MADLRKIPPTDEIEVIAPNLKRRLSGVTATIVRLVPVQAASIGIVATGPGLPVSVPRILLWRLPLLPKKKLRVWHARRNTEMLLGLVLQRLYRLNLILLFTSASQRNHTKFTRWLISKMDEVIATSEKTATYLKTSATVIHHGIDTKRFCPKGERSALRAGLGLPPGVLIGCFGRVRHQKGTDLFVDAMIRVLPAYPDHHGVVMGRATDKHTGYLRDLRARVADAGLADRIHFLPEVPVDQMPEWYQALDLFVAPQRWEGFGLTPLEAMACGVPVVAARVGAFEELIEDGKTGRLVARDDLSALAEATRSYLDNPKQRHSAGLAGRTRCAKHFALETEAERIVAIYRDLLDAPIMRSRPGLIPVRRLVDRIRFQIDKRLGSQRIENRSISKDDLMKELSGKTVAIVGNARAMAKDKDGEAIDAADIVIRLNRAPRPSGISHGKRTDWLALATNLSRSQARKIRPTRVLWMSHKRKRLPNWAVQLPGFFLHRRQDWSRLRDKFEAPPTTGVMVIDLVAGSQATSVRLYGFDFFASLSLTGHRGVAQVPHDFAAEKAFVDALLLTDPRFCLIAPAS